MWSRLISQRGPQGPTWDNYFTNIPLILLVVVLAVVVIYLLLFPRLGSVKSSESLQYKVDTMKHETSSMGENKALNVAIRLLEPDEKRVVEAVVAAGGEMLQKDITYELGFSRVKTHRVLVRLIKRGIVTTEKQYNTNKVTIAEWLQA